MGVAGCGKSTVGAALARRLGAVFMEADVHHPEANIAKMTAGEPLTDEDRAPWLDALGAAAPRAGRAVIACSALRR
ncbi:MAG: shikimate kinase, partial [Pseudomonadota bacterium]